MCTNNTHYECLCEYTMWIKLSSLELIMKKINIENGIAFIYSRLCFHLIHTKIVGKPFPKP